MSPMTARNMALNFLANSGVHSNMFCGTMCKTHGRCHARMRVEQSSLCAILEDSPVCQLARMASRKNSVAQLLQGPGRIFLIKLH